MFTVVTLSGPAIGAVGLYAGSQALFLAGIGLAVLNLFLNLASGAMRSPLLPIFTVICGAVVFAPWYFGIGIGLLIWTALEGLGELVPPALWRKQ